MGGQPAAELAGADAERRQLILRDDHRGDLDVGELSIDARRAWAGGDDAVAACLAHEAEVPRHGSLELNCTRVRARLSMLPGKRHHGA